MTVRGVVVEPCNDVLESIFGIIGTVLCMHEPVGEV